MTSPKIVCVGGYWWINTFESYLVSRTIATLAGEAYSRVLALFFSFVLLLFVYINLMSLFTQINLIKPWPEDKIRHRTLLYFDWLIGENQHLWRICSAGLRRHPESTSPTAKQVLLLIALVEISILQNSSLYSYSGVK